MQMADKETQQRLKEDDPDYIDLMHIPPAQAMLVKIVYVAELAFTPPLRLSLAIRTRRGTAKA